MNQHSSLAWWFACGLGLYAGCAGNSRLPADASGAGDAGVVACSNKPGALRAKSAQTIVAGGELRSFIYYAPSTLEANTPAPIVLVAHGFGMNAEQMFEITQYAALADRERFIVIFMNGQAADGPPWNVGDPDCLTTLGSLPLARGDDNSFIDALLAFAERDQCVDREHVFMTGFSMGGYFANELACTRNDIRAIAPHSGGSHDLSRCTAAHKPVLVLHFEGDAVVPYRCGTQSRDRWQRRNGCQANAPQVTIVQGGRCEYARGCTGDGQVAMCSFVNPGGDRSEMDPGHAWSGGSKTGQADGAPYAIPETASATTLSWEFFKKYAW